MDHGGVTTLGPQAGLSAWPEADRHERRLRASRLALRLAPMAWAIGGFASSRLRVACGDDLRHPFVAVVRGEAPPDGVLVDRMPLLVVALPPYPAPQSWLDAGTKAVWIIGADAALQVGRSGTAQRSLKQRLTVAGHPRLSLPVAEACARLAGRHTPRQ